METETIADIVREMRDWDTHSWLSRCSHNFIADLADRIEAAHNRETERMRRALKPVLDCHLCDGGQQVVSDALCAIREAKEIMKGETK